MNKLKRFIIIALILCWWSSGTVWWFEQTIRIEGGLDCKVSLPDAVSCVIFGFFGPVPYLVNILDDVTVYELDGCGEDK